MADRAGLQISDVIVAINGAPVTTTKDLEAPDAVQLRHVGDRDQPGRCRADLGVRRVGSYVGPRGRHPGPFIRMQPSALPQTRGAEPGASRFSQYEW
ncbi:PDZ domain-containing protein [Methylobacterium radiotolerans]|uniref:PDZ domain-containing protein n=1 Tax=Methylobacterium radiotolerans TaxID=31998 RepID=UPI001FDA2014|nr:PDZ domain-containing protein [Methylobacterium radiotolerans]